MEHLFEHLWTEEIAGGPIDDDGYDEVFAAWFDRESHQRVTWLAALDAEVVAMLNLLVLTRMPRPQQAAGPLSRPASGAMSPSCSARASGPWPSRREPAPSRPPR